jgi:hypothetical protein
MYLFTCGSFIDAISVYIMYISMMRRRNVTSFRDEALTYLWEIVAVTSLMVHVHTNPGYYIKLYCTCYSYSSSYYYYYYFLRGIYKDVSEIMILGYLILQLFCGYNISSSSSSSSSSRSWRVRRVSCSLILKMKLVTPSLPRSSYVPSSCWSIL